MNKDLKEKWVKRLRSGRWKQARKTLRRKPCGVKEAEAKPTDYAYCCLGVLCDIVDPKAWHGSAHGECVGSLTRETQAALGISFVHEALLIGMNDDEKKSFREIADWIEADL